MTYMNNFNYKKLGGASTILALFLLSGCTTPEIPTETAIDSSLPDLTNLYAQVCEVSSGPCIPMQCELKESTYICAESISDRTKSCSEPKYLDEIFSQYSICGEEKQTVEKLKIFSYGSTLESVTLAKTPDELEKKITEETEKIENGESSPFMDMMMGAIAGSVIGGLISNMMFGQKNAMPPARPPMTNERPMNKADLDKTKTDTKKNNDTLKKANSQTKAISKNRAEKKKATQKKATKKKSTPRKNRSSRRRR